MGFSIKNLLGLNKVVDVVDKMVVDKDAKNQIMAEIEKMGIEAELQLQEIVNKRMGTMLEKCMSVVFPMMGFVFSTYLLSNLVAYWRCFDKTNGYLPLVVDDKFYSVILSYIVGFFGNRSVKEVFKNK